MSWQAYRSIPVARSSRQRSDVNDPDRAVFMDELSEVLTLGDAYFIAAVFLALSAAAASGLALTYLLVAGR